MSKFFTSIPVDLEAVKGLLPEGAYLDKVVWNPIERRVEVHWQHDRFHTGRDYPVTAVPSTNGKWKMEGEQLFTFEEGARSEADAPVPTLTAKAVVPKAKGGVKGQS